MSLFRRWLNKTTVEVKTWMSNIPNCFINVITYPWPNTDAGEDDVC